MPAMRSLPTPLLAAVAIVCYSLTVARRANAASPSEAGSEKHRPANHPGCLAWVASRIVRMGGADGAVPGFLVGASGGIRATTGAGEITIPEKNRVRPDEGRVYQTPEAWLRHENGPCGDAPFPYFKAEVDRLLPGAPPRDFRGMAIWKEMIVINSATGGVPFPTPGCDVAFFEAYCADLVANPPIDAEEVAAAVGGVYTTDSVILPETSASGDDTPSAPGSSGGGSDTPPSAPTTDDTAVDGDGASGASVDGDGYDADVDTDDDGEDDAEDDDSGSVVLPVVLLCCVGILLLVVPCIKCKVVTKKPCVTAFPWAAFFFFVLSLVGVMISALAVDHRHKALADFGVKPDRYMTFFKSSMVFTIMTNGLALVFCFITVGCVRETLFGGSSSHPMLLASAKFLVGSIGTGILRAVLLLTMVCMSVLSHAFLVFGLMVKYLDATCGGGKQAVTKAQALITVLTEKNVIWDPDLDIRKYCEGVSDHSSLCGLYLCVGCYVAVFSQSLMLGAVSESRAKIEAIISTSATFRRTDGAGVSVSDEMEMAHRDFGGS